MREMSYFKWKNNIKPKRIGHQRKVETFNETKSCGQTLLTDKLNSISIENFESEDVPYKLLSNLPLYYYLKQTLGNPMQSIALSAKNGQTSEDKGEGYGSDSANEQIITDIEN